MRRDSVAIHIQQGWAPESTAQAAALYEAAFGQKFARAIPDREQRIAVLAQSFLPRFSFAALDGDRLVGLAGFHSPSGSLTGAMGATQLIGALGLVRGLWACALFSLFERTPVAGELVMDGIAVDAHYRGQGIGSKLLDAIVAYATEHQFRSVRLDVIDSNPRARKLYEAKGFRATKRESFPYLAWLIGFAGATTMALDASARRPTNLTQK